jgi:hypothetical protein
MARHLDTPRKLCVLSLEPRYSRAPLPDVRGDQLSIDPGGFDNWKSPLFA